MEMLSHSEITQRLGRPPEQWTFFGQCYAVEENAERRCALTDVVAHICFTIKPKSGEKGRLVIDAEAIPQFERWNPALYVKLKAGLMFLELRKPAIEADFAAAAIRARIAAAMAKYDAVRKEAKERVRGYQKMNRRERLPEYLEAMRLLLQQTGHYFKQDEDRALAIEQKTVEIEKALIAARAGQPAPQPESQPVETLTRVPAGMDLPEIPELDF